MRKVLVALVGLVGSFAVGIALFNYVLMPRLVQHDITVRVPRVAGLEVRAAERLCRQVGLQLYEEDRRHSEGVPRGRVLSQAPAADTAVKRGRSVRVMVSLGPQAVTVPDVRGMTLRQATLQLENAKLCLGRVAKVYAGTSGQVVRATRPHAGVEAAVGDSVQVLVMVGEGEQPYLMPGLVGRDLAEVRALIEARGFRVGRVTYRNARGSYPGTVLQQYPEGGALILRGGSIDLVAATPD